MVAQFNDNLSLLTQLRPTGAQLISDVFSHCSKTFTTIQVLKVVQVILISNPNLKG